MAADRILVFAKRPAAGHVKTRLTPPLPPDEAACVYEACLRDVIALAARQRARVELWYHDEPRALEYFEGELPHVPHYPQAVGDLGARMLHAFRRSFENAAERVVIVGTDSPTLPEAVLSAAFDDLHEVDVVIAPSVDGGYYLIGLRAAARASAALLFDSIEWSSATVFRSTLERIERTRLASRVLPGWYDVDTIDDLRQALTDAAADSHLRRWSERPESIQFLNAGC
ncbi:MAG: TIGR04282 family arsenosugar biosynthesis glycosyltransferase [Gemmatimonadota bacterium]